MFPDRKLPGNYSQHQRHRSVYNQDLESTIKLREIDDAGLPREMLTFMLRSNEDPDCVESREFRVSRLPW